MNSKVADAAKSSGPKVASNFWNEKGCLALYKGQRPHKYCYQCGHFMTAETRRLQSHFKGHHKGLKPAWLAHGKSPVSLVYQNWFQHLEDPNQELVPISDNLTRAFGRPKKDKELSSKEQAGCQDKLKEPNSEKKQISLLKKRPFAAQKVADLES